ncbi:NAD-dependent succinate-semialdehyde dehydrogenase [Sphingopyxis terrae]|uniref:NAD-dependent succinate-semialdehyde dehydrogenase n=1 Tax=Sphingopyxis terrae TaxID=33052 RepID=UPI002A0C59C2|nr:NAD-dependent succinate-semialdehyde dehydrogenase [Sphingopyxis terrae]MDX8356422.1 NAD-dependent succinate-semialdehyde dehydrogenase [Sphingopyxis terrae]
MVIDPATGEALGNLTHASEDDVAAALDHARRGFEHWRGVPALQRSARLRRVAMLIRERREQIASLITMELGKPYAEALAETETAAELFDWAAEEARRTYGRTIPARAPGMRMTAERQPVGPVAAFAGWNAPLITPSRKIAGALAAGCSIIIKPAETTPAVALALMRCVLDAEIPGDAAQAVFGDPDAISRQLLASPVIRLVTFTGSVAIGKHLTMLAAASLKRTVMELGGHAPVIVCDDADIPEMARLAAFAKFRNAGQICTSPTRFLVQRAVYEQFVTDFVAHTASLRLGGGFEQGVTMGPLVNEGRRIAVEALVEDAVAAGAVVAHGGSRLPRAGFFFEPTVLRDVPRTCRAMREEPFGPLALMVPWDDLGDAIALANELPLGLAGYACTTDTRRAARLREEIAVGTLAINHFTASWPETPFGGLNESGIGSEGGIEGLQAFQQVRFVSEA